MINSQMRFPLGLLIVSAALARAQPSAPAFQESAVVRYARDWPARLAPGVVAVVYGTDLGPPAGCHGQADTQTRETPSPLRPVQTAMETLIYPKELCGVQVFLGDRPCGLMYVGASQINFKVPQEAPMEGTLPMRVVYLGRASAAVKMHFDIEPATITLERPAHAGGPVWLSIHEPPNQRYGGVQYPFEIQPADFGCNEIEVRRSGRLLPRIPVRPMPAMRSGLMCGSIGIPGHAMPHPNRLPIHLQYRFDEPGAYEVRYTRWRGPPGMPDSEAVFHTAWTRIEIQPARLPAPAVPPQDPAEALSDYLPGLLGFPDAAHLALLAPYLYDADDTVRRYASQGLAYWPAEEINRRLTVLLHTRGPSDVVVEATFHTPGAADYILPYLRSDNPVLVRGAVIGVTRLLFADPPLLSAEVRARAEDALISASESVLRSGDAQTGNYYASALGGVHDPRARSLLWDFVGRNIITEQSLIAIAWFNNPEDLPRFAALMEAPAPADPMDRTYAALPYAIHRAYGDAALPVLEAAIQKSGYLWVRTNCARELVEAGRPSGFAFVAQGMEQNKSYRAEMVRFIQDRFPEMRGADDSQVLAFLKARER